ncbi:uncharacterized protein LOC129716374 isoform X3 [Leucoraja erinacea]|uniref:uncharacterized protein LOC129716374 isoform X3 n=1 Tax=Leucoraja erinaceus TaxID=7782 RepID=UPI00245692A1|nr:uncharacterized protein LOC129716374 isoform X3 [Leucoraja erinacea]
MEVEESLESEVPAEVLQHKIVKLCESTQTESSPVVWGLEPSVAGTVLTPVAGGDRLLLRGDVSSPVPDDRTPRQGWSSLRDVGAPNKHGLSRDCQLLMSRTFPCRKSESPEFPVQWNAAL